ncbi:MAG: hypothetical protein V4541_07175 [Bacteroidota bacterium]
MHIKLAVITTHFPQYYLLVFHSLAKRKRKPSASNTIYLRDLNFIENAVI